MRSIFHRISPLGKKSRDHLEALNKLNKRIFPLNLDNKNKLKLMTESRDTYLTVKQDNMEGQFRINCRSHKTIQNLLLLFQDKIPSWLIRILRNFSKIRKLCTVDKRIPNTDRFQNKERMMQLIRMAKVSLVRTQWITIVSIRDQLLRKEKLL